MIPSKKILDKNQFSYGVLYVGNGVVYLEGSGMINIMVLYCTGNFQIQAKSPHLKIVQSDKKLMMYFPSHIERRMNSLFSYVGILNVQKIKVYNFNSKLADVKIKHYDNSWENFDQVWGSINDEWNDLYDKGVNFLLNKDEKTSRGELSMEQRDSVKFKKPTNKGIRSKSVPKQLTSS